MVEFILTLILFLGSRFFPVSSKYHSIFYVVCEQDGAEILIDDCSTGFCAPCPIIVPKNNPFKLTVKKPGYEDSVSNLVCFQDKCFTYINLKRQALKLVL